MKKSSPRLCKTCRFFIPVHSSDVLRSALESGGECRRYPPHFVDASARPPTNPIGAIGYTFPIAQPHEWCGEWKKGAR